MLNTDPPVVSSELDRSHIGVASTRQAFGRIFLDLANSEPRTPLGALVRVRIAIPDLISNSYFPVIAAARLGCWKRLGLDLGGGPEVPCDRRHGGTLRRAV